MPKKNKTKPNARTFFKQVSTAECSSGMRYHESLRSWVRNKRGSGKLSGIVWEKKNTIVTQVSEHAVSVCLLPWCESVFHVLFFAPYKLKNSDESLAIKLYLISVITWIEDGSIWLTVSIYFLYIFFTRNTRLITIINDRHDWLRVSQKVPLLFLCEYVNSLLK